MWDHSVLHFLMDVMTRQSTPSWIQAQQTTLFTDFLYLIDQGKNLHTHPLCVTMATKAVATMLISHI